MLSEKNKILTFANMERARQFLISRPALSCRAIAAEVGIQHTTLVAWKNERVRLPEKYHERLCEVLAKYGFDNFVLAD